jgi:hypothetical protein
MSKNQSKFSSIKITDDALSNVDEFRGIVARGNARNTMSAQEHRDLVQKSMTQEVK